jgi:hypothetical protein
MSKDKVAGRLAYLRAQIEDERISTAEIVELQGLAEHIDPGDVQLLEWAGVPEFKEDAEEENWKRADRAATALGVYYDATQGSDPLMGKGYGDEGSDEWKEAVVGLLTDLKHLLFRVDYRLALEDLTQEAIDRWSKQVEEQEEGS